MQRSGSVRWKVGEHLRGVAGDFSDLVAWQESAALARDVVSAARQVRGVAAGEAASQLARAAESVPANVAEAYGRGLSGDGARFLRVARASAVELESHLRVAAMSSRLPVGRVDQLVTRTRRVRALIHGLLRYAEARRPRR